MKYGSPPKIIGQFECEIKEMMFYQDMPIKISNHSWREVRFEDRIDCFEKIIDQCIVDFIQSFGLKEFFETYIYISAKNLFQPKNSPYNRPGYHTDGFMTEDINYIWCNKYPTIFNGSDFNLTQDHNLSIAEMESQALPQNEYKHSVNTLLRLDQFNVHKVDENQEGLRAFLKVTFSKDKYDLLGNAHNYMLHYKWEMKPRAPTRNIPQSEIKTFS